MWTDAPLWQRVAVAGLVHYNSYTGQLCHCPWNAQSRRYHSSFRHEAGQQLNRLLKAPDKVYQTPEGQAFRSALAQQLPEEHDALAPWIGQRYKAGEVRMSGSPSSPARRDVPGQLVTKTPGNFETPIQYASAEWMPWYNARLHPSRQGVNIMDPSFGVDQMWDKVAEHKEALEAEQMQDEGLAEGKAVHRFSDGWHVRHLNAQGHDSEAALEAEGRAMGHCLGSDEQPYQKQAAQRDIDVYSLRDKKNWPHATWHTQNGSVAEVFGKEDSNLKPEYQDKYEQWSHQNGIDPSPVGHEPPEEEEQPWWDNEYEIPGPATYDDMMAYSSEPAEHMHYNAPYEYHQAEEDAIDRQLEPPRLTMGSHDWHGILDDVTHQYNNRDSAPYNPDEGQDVFDVAKEQDDIPGLARALHTRRQTPDVRRRNSEMPLYDHLGPQVDPNWDETYPQPAEPLRQGPAVSPDQTQLDMQAKTSGFTQRQRLNQAQELEDRFGPDQSDVVHHFPNGWTVRRPSFYGDLDREGHLMSNCLTADHPERHRVWNGLMSGSDSPWEEEQEPDDEGDGNPSASERAGYQIDLSNRYLHSLRDPDNLPHVSFEYSPKFGVRDSFGAHNDEPKPQYQDLVDQFGQAQESLPQNAPVNDKFSGMTANQRLRAVADHEAQFGPDTSEMVHQWPDGWSIKQLQSVGDRHREGSLMRNCWQMPEIDDMTEPLGSYGNVPGNAATYGIREHSLRDPDNYPHASFYHDVSYSPWELSRTPHGVIESALGHGNSGLSSEHAQRIADWADSLPDTSYRDLEPYLSENSNDEQHNVPAPEANIAHMSVSQGDTSVDPKSQAEELRIWLEHCKKPPEGDNSDANLLSNESDPIATPESQEGPSALA